MANLKTTGVALATAAALLFGKGQNSCKGKGYVVLTKEECDAAKKTNEAEKKS